MLQRDSLFKKIIKPQTEFHGDNFRIVVAWLSTLFSGLRLHLNLPLLGPIQLTVSLEKLTTTITISDTSFKDLRENSYIFSFKFYTEEKSTCYH